MKKVFIEKLKNCRTLLLVVFSLISISLFFNFINAINDVYKDVTTAKNIKANLDPNIYMRGLSLYIGDDEVYKFLRVPGGNILISDSSNTKYYTLNSFLLGETPVTVRMYEYVVNGVDQGKDKNALQKYYQIAQDLKSKDDWLKFIEILNKKTGHIFRMPTVEEWEYAAQGGKESKGYKFSGSNDIDEVAIYNANYKKNDLRLCKQKSPNELGFYDMSGLVMELTSTTLLEKDPTMAMYADKIEKEFIEGNYAKGGDANQGPENCVISKNVIGANVGTRLILVE